VSGWSIVLLRLPYLAVSRMFAFIRILPMNDADKKLQMLALLHQLVVLQRQIDRLRVTAVVRAFLACWTLLVDVTSVV
jgi:putative transposase